RRIQIDLTKTAPEVSDSDQRTSDQKRDTSYIQFSQTIAGEEERFRRGVNHCAENHRQSDDQKFDAPTHRSNGGTKCSLQVGQNQHRRDEDRCVQKFGRRLKYHRPAFEWDLEERDSEQLIT